MGSLRKLGKDVGDKPGGSFPTFVKMSIGLRSGLCLEGRGVAGVLSVGGVGG